MKVELKDAKVELEVGNGKASLHINGHCIELPKVMGIRLIFGDDAVGSGLAKTNTILPSPTPAPKEKKKEIRRGCQTALSKRKLSASLKKFYEKKRRKERAQEKAQLAQPPTKQVSKKSNKYLNGTGTHHVN